jgi:hypothetical protein
MLTNAFVDALMNPQKTLEITTDKRICIAEFDIRLDKRIGHAYPAAVEFTIESEESDRRMWAMRVLTLLRERLLEVQAVGQSALDRAST